MIKKNIIGILALIASNTICSADIYKDYHEASKTITKKILNDEDLLSFSKSFRIEDVTSFFENMILASHALNRKDKALLDAALNNFAPLFEKPHLLKNCFNSFCTLFGHRKYAKHLSLAAIRSHAPEINIFIYLCKKMVESTVLNLPANITVIIENYQKDIKFSKEFGLESDYNKQVKALN